MRLLRRSHPEGQSGKLGLFTGIDDMKFRKQVTPGDVLELAIEFTAFRRGMGKPMQATVDGQVAPREPLNLLLYHQSKGRAVLPVPEWKSYGDLCDIRPPSVLWN